MIRILIAKEYARVTSHSFGENFGHTCFCHGCGYLIANNKYKFTRRRVIDEAKGLGRPAFRNEEIASLVRYRASIRSTIVQCIFVSNSEFLRQVKQQVEIFCSKTANCCTGNKLNQGQGRVPPDWARVRYLQRRTGRVHRKTGSGPLLPAQCRKSTPQG